MNRWTEFLENLKVFVWSKRALDAEIDSLRSRLSLLDDLRARLRESDAERQYYAELLLTRAGYNTDRAKQSHAETKELAQSAVTNWKARKRALESRSSEEARRLKEEWASKIEKEEERMKGENGLSNGGTSSVE